MDRPSANPSRRIVTALVCGAFPLTCLAASQPLSDLEPIDDIYRLLEEYQRAKALYRQASDRVEAIELRGIAAGQRIEYFEPADFDRLFGKETPEEQQRVRSGDAWGKANGLDAAVEENDRHLTEAQRLEAELLQAQPTTLAGLAAVLDFLHLREEDGWSRIGGVDEEPSVGIFRHLAGCVRRLA